MARHNNIAVVIFLPGRNLAEEWSVSGVNNIVVIFHLGVEQATQEEESHRNEQADKQTEQCGARFVGRHRGAVDSGRVEHLSVGLDRGLANH